MNYLRYYHEFKLCAVSNISVVIPCVLLKCGITNLAFNIVNSFSQANLATCMYTVVS